MDIYLVQKIFNREALGAMILSSVLKRGGLRVFLVEANYSSLIKRLGTSENPVLAFTTPTVLAKDFLSLNRSLKSQFPRTLSLFGGPHPTFFPEMIEEEGVDGICLGEGEHALLDLARNLSEGKPITHIQNWWIKQEGKIYRNPLRPLIEDLNSLPFPDRSFSDRIISFKMGRASVITSRGCPYQCSYCFNHAYNRLYNNTPGKVRRRSVDNVIEEIKQLKQGFPLKMVIFQDDTFILDRGWLEEFSSKYKKEIGVPFRCMAHPRYIDSGSVGLLKEAGCMMIGMGIECGDAHYLRQVLKRDLSLEQILEAAQIIRKQGISLRTHNLLGLPGAGWDVELKTILLNSRCRPDLARASVSSFYPGTDIYVLAKEHGLTQGDFSAHFSGSNWVLDRGKSSKIQQRQLDNLSCLFPLLVRFPFLIPLTQTLIRLPLKRFFSFINRFCEVGFLYFHTRSFEYDE